MRKVYLAGIGNSGPQHWQYLWHAQDGGGIWVEHADWDVVSRAVWVDETRRALEGVAEPVVFVAHSLGCLLAAEYLAAHGTEGIAGAFLVSVPDVHGPSFPAEATGFRAAQALTMPVKSTMVASRDDPYGSAEHAQQVAARWGSDLKDVGSAGHINASSGLGRWSDGAQWLDQFTKWLAR